MAINTVPDAIRTVDTGVYTFFGYPVPPNVAAVEMSINPIDYGRNIRWVCHGSKQVHSMDFEHATEENILAVLTAMRLSC